MFVCLDGKTYQRIRENKIITRPGSGNLAPLDARPWTLAIILMKSIQKTWVAF
jgi:hypothetical protein